MTDLTRMAEGTLEGWEHYQQHLITMLKDLTPEQLDLRIAPHLRSIYQIAVHIVGGRARWMVYALDEQDESIAALTDWDRPTSPQHAPAEIVQALTNSWDHLRASLDRWTPDQWSEPFTRTYRDETDTYTRSWIIWHLIEHDLHHGGEISFALGFYRLPTPDL